MAEITVADILAGPCDPAPLESLRWVEPGAVVRFGTPHVPVAGNVICGYGDLMVRVAGRRRVLAVLVDVDDPDATDPGSDGVLVAPYEVTVTAVVDPVTDDIAPGNVVVRAAGADLSRIAARDVHRARAATNGVVVDLGGWTTDTAAVPLACWVTQRIGRDDLRFVFDPEL
jgi:hypothetical protein